MKRKAIFALLCALLSFSGIANAQKLSLSLRKATVQQAVMALQKQGYTVSVKTADVNMDKEVSINAQNQDLAAVAAQIFAGQDVVCSVSGKTLVVTKASAAPAPKNEDLVVSGQVIDENGEALLGAGVLIKGTATGTVTDASGRYSLKVGANQTLQFSYIGYETKDVEVAGKGIINCTLAQDGKLLDEVVVVGYGTQSRKTLTTAVSKVDGDKLLDAPVTSVGEALKGKVTGLRIASSNNLAGETPRFLIRGGSSINRSNDPLCLVDGMERDFSDLNPNDIESIEVLKDAASAAIYGSRASNGVILVTTRKGNSFKQPQIVFDAQLGYQGPARKWKMANATEFLTIVRPAALQGPNSSLVLDGANGAGVGNTTSTATYSTRYLQDGETVPDGYLSMPDPIDPSKTIIYTDTDWQSQWFQDSFYHKEYVGINGGSKAMKYAASVGYVGDKGILPMNTFSKITFHGNTSFKITKNLEASTTFDFSHSDQMPTTDNFFNAIGRGLMMSPTHIGTYADGTFATGGTNKNQQSADFYKAFYDRERVDNKFMGNMNIKWNITDWLTATAQYALYDNNYRGSYYVYGQLANGSTNLIETTRKTTETRTETMRHNFQAFLSADKSFGKHRINGTLGYDWSKWQYLYLNASNYGSLSDKVPYLQSGSDNTSGTMSMSNNDYSTALISYFGRVGYNYADKYIFSATFRADGSSLFVGKNKWGYFPSVSGAWVVSEEPFYAPVKDAMNTLKLRLSYGQTGNNNIARTAPLGAYSVGTYAGYNTLLPSTMQNSGLKWETTTQFDAGLDMGFLGDRIRVVTDYYNKLTTDLIYSITLPDTGQLSSVYSNVGSVRFWGFEFELHTVNIDKKNFRWETDFTYSFSRNRVESLPEEYKYEIVDMYGNATGEYGYRIGGTKTATGYRFAGTAVGEPLGSIWGYKVAGVLQTDEQAAAAYYDTQSHGYRRSDGQSITGRKDAGDFEWVNRYGTAKNSAGQEQIDATDQFLLGNVMPHSTGGINNTIYWNRFTFNIYFDYALGHSIYNYMKTRMMQNTLGYSNANIDTELVGQAWRYPGDQSKVARFFPNDADYGNRNYSRISDYNVEKADYLCLRDLSVFYDLPDKWAKACHMKKLTVGISGNTLYYFTGVSGAISPETGMGTGSDAGMYTSVSTADASGSLVPPTRKILMNIKITF